MRSGGKKRAARLKFEDVKKCRDIAELNAFTRQYIEERGLKGEAAKRVVFALLHAWKSQPPERME